MEDSANYEYASACYSKQGANRNQAAEPPILSRNTTVLITAISCAKSGRADLIKPPAPISESFCGKLHSGRDLNFAQTALSGEFR